MITDLIERHSLAFSCSNKHTDSSAIFTLFGGFPIERTSTKCCFFIDLTASDNHYLQSSELRRHANSPFWASMTAGSTWARSAMTSCRFCSMWMVCSLSCSWISWLWTFFFSASCWSLTIWRSLALAASFLACSS